MLASIEHLAAAGSDHPIHTSGNSLLSEGLQVFLATVVPKRGLIGLKPLGLQ
jgi:hypothetical protein